MPPSNRPRLLIALSLLTVLTLSACSGSGAGAQSPPSTARATEPGAPTRSTAPAAAAGGAVTTLADCAPARPVQALRALHRFSVSPDDVTVDASGHLWVTAREANQLIGMRADGSVTSVQAVGGGPEGVVSDGSAVYVAEQNVNAVVFVGSPPHTVVSLPNHTANPGIDGIGIDAAGRRLLVPDSANGRLVAVALDGVATVQVLAGQLGRPVAATMDGTGDIVVASESQPGLTVVSPTGVKRALGHFTDLDEVVWYRGLLYVTELDHHDVVAVDPVTGASAVVAGGLPAPQGLAVTAGGALKIVDSTTRTLYSTPACAGAA